MSVPTRVIVLTPWFPPQPGDREGNFVLDQVRAVAATGIREVVIVALPRVPRFLRSRVAAWKHGVKFDTYRDQSFELVELRYPSVPRNILGPLAWPVLARTLTARIGEVLGRYPSGLIHAHTEAMAYVAAHVYRRTGLPYVVTLHGVDPALDLSGRRGRARQCLEALASARRIVVVGSPLQRYLERHLAAEVMQRVAVVANGFELPPDVQPSSRYPRARRFRIVSASNLHRNKGVDRTLCALAALGEAGHADVDYVVVGDGAERGALERMSRDLGLSDRVWFTGYLSHREALHEVAAADIFCLPSWREAAGVAYLEAMALGKVTIGCLTQGPEDFIESGKTGYLVDPGSADALTHVLRTTLEAWDQARCLGNRAREHVRSTLTWAHNAQRIREIYRDAIAA